ncbi:HD domain-containing phosphohydrolase [Candidatus Margulisiibacteriota bacterium]
MFRKIVLTHEVVTLRESNAQMKGQLAQNKILRELSNLIVSTLNIEEIKDHVVAAARKYIGADAASLLLERNGYLTFDVTQGEKSSPLKDSELKIDDTSIAGAIAYNHQPLIVPNAYNEPKFNPSFDNKTGYTTKNILGVPLIVRDKLVGVLEFINKMDDRGEIIPFIEADVEAAMTFANSVAIAVENARLFAEKQAMIIAQQQEHLEMLVTLSRTVAAKDYYTAGHNERVMHYSLIIGQMLGLSGKEMETLKIDAQLHDIGKIAIPDEILLNPGRLTSEEFKVVQQHPGNGVKILNPLSHLTKFLGVGQHQEKWNGSGYPEGLKGEAISIYGRIIAIVDILDAKTSGREYDKDPEDFSFVFMLMVKLAGTQLNPNIMGNLLDQYLLLMGQNSSDYFFMKAFVSSFHKLFADDPFRDVFKAVEELAQGRAHDRLFSSDLLKKLFEYDKLPDHLKPKGQKKDKAVNAASN